MHSYSSGQCWEREDRGSVWHKKYTARYGTELINNHVWRIAYLLLGDALRDVWLFAEENIYYFKHL